MPVAFDQLSPAFHIFLTGPDFRPGRDGFKASGPGRDGPGLRLDRSSVLREGKFLLVKRETDLESHSLSLAVYVQRSHKK